MRAGGWGAVGMREGVYRWVAGSGVRGRRRGGRPPGVPPTGISRVYPPWAERAAPSAP
jgi:hypothetical protein